MKVKTNLRAGKHGADDRQPDDRGNPRVPDGPGHL
jgi:hypothetical protein